MSQSIPAGSTVLITGVTGFIAAYTAEAFLEAGFKVRGTARNASKAGDVTTRFQQKYGKDRFEVVSVPDIAAENAFDDAAKGVSSIVHIASITSLSPVYDEVVPQTVDATISALTAAAKQPSVKTVVLTSSVIALGDMAVPKPTKLTDADWHDAAIDAAKNSPADTPGREWIVYAASKVEGEKAAFEWVKANKPHFTFSTVLPAAVFGPAIDGTVKIEPGSTGSWPYVVLKNDVQTASQLMNISYVSIKDVATIHVAAATSPKAAGHRIITAAAPFTYDRIAKVWRKIRPEAGVKEEGWSTTDSKVEYDTALGVELLKEHGRKGWTSLEETLALYP